jgi:hypothetical protein
MTEAEAWEITMRTLDACRDDPVAFHDLVLRRPPYWDRQVEICRSVVKYGTTVCYTGNAVGKGFVVGGIVPWWLVTRPDSLVILTGPSQQVLGSVTLKEVRRAFDGAVLPFGGRISQTIRAAPGLVQIADGWQCLAFSTTSIERASGQHSGDLLVIVEEASGVDEEIWDALDGLGYTRLLVIGNPIRAEGRFVDLIRQADRDRSASVPPEEACNAIRIPSTESPHATWDHSPVGLASRPWIEGMVRRYGPNSLWVRSHIKAEIPIVSADVLIPLDWLDRAAVTSRDPDTLRPDHPAYATRRISGDLGEGVGRDSTSLFVTDDLGVLEVICDDSTDLATTACRYSDLGQKWGVPPARMSYDKGGLGREMALHLSRWDILATPYTGASGATSAEYTNLRTQAAMRLRMRLDPEGASDWRKPWHWQPRYSIPPGDYWPRLRDELSKLTYHLVGSKVALLSKEDHAKSLGHSPDSADALIQRFSFD